MPNRSNRGWMLIAVAAWLILGAGACGSDDDSTGGSADAGQDAADVQPASDVTSGGDDAEQADAVQEDTAGTDPRNGETGGLCPESCQYLTPVPSSAGCGACDGGYCYAPVSGANDRYCTKECSSEADCADLEGDWKCDGAIGICKRERQF